MRRSREAPAAARRGAARTAWPRAQAAVAAGLHAEPVHRHRRSAAPRGAAARRRAPVPHRDGLRGPARPGHVCLALTVVRGAERTAAGRLLEPPRCAVDLAAGVVGLAAPPAMSAGLARWLVAQFAARCTGRRTLPRGGRGRGHRRRHLALAALARRERPGHGRTPRGLAPADDAGRRRRAARSLVLARDPADLPAGCAATIRAVPARGRHGAPADRRHAALRRAGRPGHHGVVRVVRTRAGPPRRRGRRGATPRPVVARTCAGRASCWPPAHRPRSRKRWRRRRRRRRGPACSGVGADGPVVVDLDRDGPHVLVAGTTGSGQVRAAADAWSPGWPLEHPPSEMTFLLVDYKGGAAFAECADLPHTVGLVTDLDDAADPAGARARSTARSGAASGCSPRRVLRTCREYRRRCPAAAPARLVVVVDEFATLADELPGFVTGPGRHRPARPVARAAPRARHPAPGRGGLAGDPRQLRAADLPAGHQCRRLGRRRSTRPRPPRSRRTPPAAATCAARVDDAVPDRPGGRPAARARPRTCACCRSRRATGSPSRRRAPTPICAVRRTRRAPRQPDCRARTVRGCRRCPPGSPLGRRLPAPTADGLDRLAIGLVDRPDEQRQPAADPRPDHRRRGADRRRAAVRTHARAAHPGPSPRPRAAPPGRARTARHRRRRHRPLGPARRLPHVGTLADRRRRIRPAAASDRPAARRGSTAGALPPRAAGAARPGRRLGGVLPPPRTTTTAAAPPSGCSRWLARAAPPAATVVRRSRRPGRAGRAGWPAVAATRFVLHLHDPGDYAHAGVAAARGPDGVAAGRGRPGRRRREFQFALPAAAAERAGRPPCAARGRRGASGCARCPTRSASPDSRAPAHGRVVPRRRRRRAAPIGVDLLGAGARLLIAGPPRSGRSTALRTLLAQTASRRRPIVAAPPRSPLRAGRRERRRRRARPGRRRAAS